MIAAAGAAGVQPANAVRLGQGDLLSSLGEQGIDDLRACLASSDTLDAYYLVDSSGSMKKTDPGILRAELLANSLRELASLSEDVNVSYSLGFFSSRFTASIPWTAVTAGSISQETDRVTDAVRAQPASGGTDWQSAIAGAQTELQSSGRDGCKALIWLTDGGISVGNNTPETNATALNQLCGMPIRADGAPPVAGAGGVFNELRQAGTVVFGVMLRDNGVKDSQIEYVPYMRPLVEGEGEVAGSPVTCGEHPIPERFAHGVYLEASSADDLAVVFLRLGALVGGGTESPFAADGTFPVDAGIASFSIVTSSPEWTLHSPQGRAIDASTAEDSGFRLERSGGAARLISPLIEARDVGTWRWESASREADTLYYASGLRMQLDEPKTFLAGADNELSGRVLRDGSDRANLTDYRYELSLSVVTPAGVSEVNADRIDLDEEDGEFTFHYLATDASGVVTLQASSRVSAPCLRAFR
ncbi:vWA domain-containing protein [Homoserinibacter gongjuensis]|uniref:VWFA domain-containing protein n=1 Tax=Homoserinibacter gongjuensis TaxID=1162968 RepID=A0ABQ6K0H0_9MICO|nr:vWA domain-containing protein [Homoserinibacter gongjuensis]GMA93078.1 hypothetical protein GCM10025869_36070 [Homoserinibacter gongjuensis]